MTYIEKARKLAKCDKCEVSGKGRFALVLKSEWLTTINLFSMRKDALDEAYMNSDVAKATIYDLKWMEEVKL